MNHYYIFYPRNFSNEYKLYSVEAGSKAEQELIEKGFYRTTRKEAEKLCRAERQARRDNPSFSGFAPAYVVAYEDVR